MILRYVLHAKSRFSMNITQKAAVLLILILFCIILAVSRYYCNTKAESLKQIELNGEQRFPDIGQDETAFLKNKLRKIARAKSKVKYIKNLITPINDQQRIGRVKKLNATAMLKALQAYKNFTNQSLDTVLVIQVHGNHRYVQVLLESLRRVLGIHESLLIFVHDQYHPKVHKILNDVHFTRVMQIFYPYSVQLHPYRFPGEDLKFCPELNNCISSNERDPIESQKKLFWWWSINKVFDQVEILKKYDGYIYFLEVEQYLTSDFILMAKTLEKKRPYLCPECKILSLATRLPKPELYRRQNSSLIISFWGWMNPKYISSGFGLNRTTWNEIKELKEEFCYFDDNTWENSLKYLATKSPQKAFYMLSIEGPRIFPTNDCTKLVNRTTCDIVSTYLDVAKFIRTAGRGLFPESFKLEFDDMGGLNNTDIVEEIGGWDDARDRELCIFMASHGRRLYY